MRKRLLTILFIVTFIFTNVFGVIGPISLAQANSQNILKNPSFEELEGKDGRDARYWNMNDSINGWTSASEAITGTRFGWTQPNKAIYQEVTIPTTGMYKLSANARGKGNDTQFGIRKPDGTALASIIIPMKNTMVGKREEVPGILLTEGDQVQVYYGYGDSWSHIEDVELIRDDAAVANLIVNGEFKSELSNWQTTEGVSMATIEVDSKPIKAAQINPNQSISQKISVPLTGKYRLSLLLQTEGDGGSFGVRDATGTVIEQLDITTSVNEQRSLEEVVLQAGSEVEVFISSGENTLKVAQVKLEFDFVHFDNSPSTATDVAATGLLWTGQSLTGHYKYQDAENHREGLTTYNWMVADSADGAYTIMPSEHGKQLKLTADYAGKYIKFAVIPVDIFGQAGEVYTSEAVGPIAGNLVVNGSFDDEKHGWSYDGAFIYKKGTEKIAKLDPGPVTFLSQQITIPSTGYYKYEVQFNRSDDAGGIFGIRYPGGSEIARSEVPAGNEPFVNSVGQILLQKGMQVEVYFTGIPKNGKWLEIDNVGLYAESMGNGSLPDMHQILAVTTAKQVGIANIDALQRKVIIQMPYGTDLKAIAPEITVSEGSTVVPQSGSVQNFTSPLTYIVTGSNGIAEEWTVECVVLDKQLTIDTSNTKLKDAFNWAIPKAKSYVRTGKQGLINRDEYLGNNPEIKDYIPSYWAGYAHRYAFYSRDMVHQMAGAHLLGLDQENKSMLTAFAGTSSALHKWYPVWALNFDGSTFKLDYDDENSFVREVPAVFELVEKAYKMYLWTGDKAYINDETLWNYYTKAVTEFVELHDKQLANGIAEGTGQGIFEGAASYNERDGEAVVEGGDGIASQYQAFLAYAEMAKARGDQETYQLFADKSVELKRYFNEDWGVKGIAEGYMRGYEANGKSYSEFGKEASWFMPMKLITEAGERTNKFLDLIDKMSETPGQAPVNIEAYSYLPDTFFPYGKNETAWKWMNYILDRLHVPHELSSQGTNGDYPELSYTLISHTVEGLMGITPNAPEQKVATLSRLPQAIGWLSLDHINVGEHDLYVKHEGAKKTTLTNHEGAESIHWEAQFAGSFPYIWLNGKAIAASTKVVNGVTISFTDVEVQAGETIVAVPSLKGNDNGTTDPVDPTNPTDPGEPSNPVTETPTLSTPQPSNNNVSAKLVVTPQLQGDHAVAQVTAAKWKELLQQAAKTSEQSSQIVITLAEVKGAQRYDLQLPSFTGAIPNSDKLMVEVRTPQARIIVPWKALQADTQLKSEIRIGVQVVNGKPVVTLDALAGEQVMSKLRGAQMKVYVTYKPTTDEWDNHEFLVVQQGVDGSGTQIVSTLPSSKYDPRSNEMGFRTSNFGTYGLAYTPRLFNDLLQTEWARKSIEVLAAKGIIQGMSQSEFAPQQSITRADFIALLVKTLGLQADGVKTDAFADVKSGDTHADMIALAKHMGIIQGTGDQLFNPKASISRQDMMVMVARALQAVGIAGKDSFGSETKRFEDSWQVSPYAIDASGLLIHEGLIKGHDNKLNPTGMMTRAEAAVLLYELSLKQ
ncbi:S-layer homology domain-containing protein [Paenibacillus sp. N1-5-1-14]|uniref:S-layer homology domain-containing protein n=1 Tax=Paenibacillus radicibacter TaxID=2972488 RepID=UPI002159A01C|nr:S-layer homology domain-containing protein [Paenibacillus radicibacter]MCR8644900.1 S-layer homology domain-containing protein [Paenibacillus radicibacter]